MNNSNEKSAPYYYAYDAKSITKNVRFIIKKAQQQIRKLDKELQSFDREAQKKEEEIAELLSDNPNARCEDNSAWTLSDRLIIRLRFFLNTINSCTCFPPQRDLFDGVGAENDLYERIILPLDQIVTHLKDEAVFLKMPMLGSLQTASDYKKNSLRISNKYLRIYRKSIIKSIELNPDFDSYDFGKFKDKIVHFLFVYNNESIRDRHLIDNDNHDVKAVTDAITLYTGTGDGPLVCSFFLESTFTSSIPEGTYVTMTSKEHGLMSASKIIDFWKSDPTISQKTETDLSE